MIEIDDHDATIWSFNSRVIICAPRGHS